MIKNICVYCSSSNYLEDLYYKEARTLGRLMAKQRLGLVYGGGNVGIMGVLAKTVHEHDGYVFGVIPRQLQNREGVAYEVADDLVITETMRERKAIMFDKADAFITLPGGLGTLEEFLETLTLKQLGYHHLPIVLVNTNGFYDTLLDMIGQFQEERFVGSSVNTLFYLANSAEEALDRLVVGQ